MHKSLPHLTSKLSSWITTLIHDRERLEHVLQEFSSPVNVHNIEPFKQNLSDFRDLLSEQLSDWQLFYSHKANRCHRFVTTALLDGFGIDSSSFEELNQALLLGATKDTAILTSSVKTRDVIDLALSRDVIIILDNLDELDLVSSRAKLLGQTARVGLRLSGFPHKGEALQSRFGFPCTTIHEVLDKLSLNIRCEGIHFHLNGYSLEERTSALDFIFSSEILNQPWLRFIDIGGGIPVCYLESESEWRNFQHALFESLQGIRTPITYANNNLGCSSDLYSIEHSRSFYPFWNNLSKTDYLKTLLSSTLSNNKTVAKNFNDRKIEFRCEPGRSILDQCGITVARVAFRKPAPDGRHFVGLEMNSSQMASSSADFLLDPVVLYSGTANSPVEVYFVGSYCLERDLLLKRAIALDRLPSVGDIVVFPNTAGYMMHLHESRSHAHPFAENLWLDTQRNEYPLIHR